MIDISTIIRTSNRSLMMHFFEKNGLELLFNVRPVCLLFPR